MNNPSEVSFLLVLAEGLASFFSPCVIPLLPLYIGYLSGNARMVKEDGTVEYNRKKVFFQTVCFVLGISFSFLILGLTFTAIGQALQKYKVYFQLVAGILIIVLGLFQLGVFKSNFLSKERRLNVNTDKPMGPWMAFVLGFLFSFTWTPCVGPALTSILLLVSTTSGGYWYVLVYAIGFVGPFLLLGLFTSEVLNFLKRKRNLLPVVVKIGAVILLIMGVYSIYQGIDALTNPPVEEEESVLPQFTLPDINGKQHALSDYKGKVIFLNFFTTWCGYCQQEIIHLDEVNKE
ncbi:MAG: redoxin domain-containing protein, partial [Erysipelotrichaceae bacterium]|nr:redoxin domain-containing protein [Erysipelotrichaceae bacterium]